jgi:hypothetical protein
MNSSLQIASDVLRVKRELSAQLSARQPATN